MVAFLLDAGPMHRAHLLLVLPALVAACSSTSTASSAPYPDGPYGDPPADTTGRTPSAPTVGAVNGCSGADFAANDRTADDAERIIRAPDEGAVGPFTPRCMRVRIGQTITWTNLAPHDMKFVLASTSADGFQTDAGDAGGTHFVLGDPDGGTDTTAVAFERLTIAFTANDHPSIMLGAVDVVP